MRLRFITPSDTAFHVYDHVVRLGSKSLAEAEKVPLASIEAMMDGAYDGHQIWTDEGWESIQDWMITLVRAEGVQLVAEQAGVSIEHIEAVLDGCEEASADLASFVARNALDVQAQPKQRQGSAAVWLARQSNTGKCKPRIH